MAASGRRVAPKPMPGSTMMRSSATAGSSVRLASRVAIVSADVHRFGEDMGDAVHQNHGGPLISRARAPPCRGG